MRNNINVTKPFLPPIEDYIEKVKEIWNNNWLTNNGPMHKEFERNVNDYLKTQCASLFTNGHLALDIAIKSLNLKGEVITTPFTFASTVHAITANDLTPVFCDIEQETFNIDVSKIEALITDKTSAILPVHVFGNPCDVEAIETIAKKHNLKVIYDAAHTFGVEIHGKGIGNYGDLSMFSLHATKVFHSIEGGILTFNDESVKSKLEAYKNFGMTGQEVVSYAGLNAKMNEFQAAMGLVNLEYIDSQIEKRKQIAYTYRDCLNNIDGIKYLNDITGIRHNYSYFPVVVDESEFKVNRNQLFDELKEYNIYTRKYFYPLCSDFDCYSFSSSELSNAKYVSDRILALPIYGDLTLEEVRGIGKAIVEISTR